MTPMDTTPVPEEKKTTIGATIANLHTCDFCVSSDVTTEELKEAFDRHADLPGAMVRDDGGVVVVSRDNLFGHLSRPFFREIFIRKPIKEFVEMWCGEALRLHYDCTINRAAELALARPHSQAFEPILVDYDECYGLLDTHVLLVSQAQMLSLSRIIEEQRDAAEAANRSKSEFLANISHELRTPLHGIMSYTKFGLNEAATADRDELQKFFQNVDHCAANLLNLVNDLLDLAKMESGRMSFNFQQANLIEVIEVVIDEFRSLCAERDIEIFYDHSTDAVGLTIDADRIQQVVRNLLSNAVKFSPPSGNIYVRSRRVGECVLTSVRDEGVGIPGDELDSVFDKFVQSSKTITNQGGTGLGLAICNEIVAGHRGRIWVENNVGAGCIFYLELPITVPDSLSASCSRELIYNR